MNRAPSRKPVSGPKGLRRACREILAGARRQIDRPAADAAAVHEFRKAMKRWRAMLRLYEPLLGRDAARLRSEAGDLARALAGPRDLRSALDALADLREEGLPARTRAAITHRLESLGRSAEAAAMTEQLRSWLLASLDSATTAFRRWPRDPPEITALAEGLTASYARARRAIPADWPDASGEALHVLRQRTIVHRYQMELAMQLWPKIGRASVGAAQKLRDRLGHHQDLAMLRDLTGRRRPLARWHRTLAPLIAARQAEHAAAAARIAYRLYAEKPKAFRRRLMSRAPRD